MIALLRSCLPSSRQVPFLAKHPFKSGSSSRHQPTCLGSDISRLLFLLLTDTYSPFSHPRLLPISPSSPPPPISAPHHCHRHRSTSRLSTPQLITGTPHQRRPLFLESRARRKLLSDNPTNNDTPPPQITIMPAKKIRCTAKDCRDAAQRIVGDCGFCQGHFCGKHRLLEDHKCSGLEDCKKESHERNAAQLESERTQMIRGV